jgi:fatty-acid desaturase
VGATAFSEACVLLPLALSVIAAVAVTQLAIFSTTIYLHRTATHRGLALHPAVAVSFRFSLWLTTGISTREWVAVHRKHHAFTDEAGDPHSPLLKGFWRVQLGNVFYYIREARNAEVVQKYAPDINDDFWIAGSSTTAPPVLWPAPRSCARQSGEIDPAWPILKLLTLLTLARPQRTIPSGPASG